MQNKIILTPDRLDEKAVAEITDDQTEQCGEYGKRYTPAQVRAALWRALDDYIDRAFDDLELLVGEKRFDEYLGEPETFDDPRAVRCECGHVRGDHDEDDLQICLGDHDPGHACQCRAFRAALQMKENPC